MRIIKPILEKDENSDIAENAARAPFFVVFDDNKFNKFIKNPFIT
jgi:predicted Fe-Mo cluster-binding NifX family protein